MRRRLEIFIPIVLLSVLVQLIAPISAFRVVANAVSDPLYMASICSGVATVSRTVLPSPHLLRWRAIPPHEPSSITSEWRILAPLLPLTPSSATRTMLG